MNHLLWTNHHISEMQTEVKRRKNKPHKVACSLFVPSDCRSRACIAWQQQVARYLEVYSIVAASAGTAVAIADSLQSFLPLWGGECGDEIKAYQVDESIKLMALLWHEALKARNLLAYKKECSSFFPHTAFLRLSICAGPRVAKAQNQHGKRKRLEACCYWKQAMTLNASWASTLNCNWGSEAGKRWESSWS